MLRLINRLKHRIRNNSSFRLLNGLVSSGNSLRYEFVSATRASKEHFHSTTLLGRSIEPFIRAGLASLHVQYENTQPLANIYNARIAESAADILIFLHDDVYLSDELMLAKLAAGLSRFDVLGIAGNTRRIRNQPAWAFIETEGGLTWDYPHLSGEIKHGRETGFQQDRFGPTPADCALLDGVFLAAKAATLRRNKIRFDPTFAFHFYDLDFCRACTESGLALATWPIDIIHGSGGRFGTPEWLAVRETYARKWGS